MSNDAGQKFGSGHAAAMGRAGMKELAQVLPAFPGQGVQPVEEPGLISNPTPQEVVAAKAEAPSYQSMLAGRAAAAPQAQREGVMER